MLGEDVRRGVRWDVRRDFSWDVRTDIRMDIRMDVRWDGEGYSRSQLLILIYLQVRRELYSQCFDELIRQSTINCVERGLLMLRVRDELKMTLMAYQTLYESSIAFGIRKALKAEQGKAEMESYIQKLELEKAKLDKEVHKIINN